MKSKSLLLWTVFFAGALSAADGRRIAVEWRGGQPEGELSVTGGSLAGLSVARGRGAVTGNNRFGATAPGPFRLEIQLSGSEAAYGPASAIVTVNTTRNPVSFFLRDVRAGYPIYIPAYGVAVTDASDARSYQQIENAVRARGLQTKLESVAAEPEADFESAAANTRSLMCQTWLGLGRDVRIFGVSERLDWIQPRFHGREVPLPETGDKPTRYNFLMGRGWGAVDKITRRLENGALPILRGTLVDDDITYNMTAFVALESRSLTRENVRGTHFLVADGYGAGHMFTKQQQAEHDSLLPAEMNQPEETVLFVRITAVNTSAVPRYAFFKNPAPTATRGYQFDGAEGFAAYPSGRVFAVSLVNGKPLSAEEVAIDLKPGEAAQIEFRLPNRPISRERAMKLRSASFEERHGECRLYWQQKLDAAAQIRLPEQRITEMLRAGLLHLDLITYGLEPEGTLTSTIGVYSAIGSESSPIIQFMDSMGWHDTARRALMYFLDKQHDDGFIQNFGGYMLETGAVLWSIGEHYRYTHDDAWVRQIAPKLIKACEYLRKWRARNLRDDLRGKGYGMLEGKTADPEDPFRSFMLNGYAYLGMARVAETLATTDPAQSEKWRKEADALKSDIRAALFGVMGRSPVVSLANGTWSPTAPPWVEYRGPLMLFADGGNWFTHGAMVSRDSLLGPVYLIFQEVLEPNEDASTFLLNFHNDLMTTRNVAFSQPYYSRHPISHLRRGEVKAFLKAYYNTLSSLADRQTYTFWEHYFGASPHKTHEEGWFLMDSRWMLYMERGAGIDLLPGIPRAYLGNGKRIELNKVATYFGPLSLRVDSDLDRGRIQATVDCPGDRKPAFVDVRLPHPQGRKATRVEGGKYNPETERVRVEPFTGRADIAVTFE
ncbi:MAG: hypothetical protein IT165_02255 [Bryobacterales bacterium]|nr:hypothetical protein [Bryobacterales bacterium]